MRTGDISILTCSSGYLLSFSLLELVGNIGKSYVVWQEIFDNGLDVNKDTMIDIWKGSWQDEMAKVTAAGYDAILSGPWYLGSISYGTDWIPVCAPLLYLLLLSYAVTEVPNRAI